MGGKRGLTGSAAMKKLGEQTQAGKFTQGKAELGGAVSPNAGGGIVTTIQGGMAISKRIPAGEGMAAIGKGERIVPAGRGGGGGGKVIELRLKGDLGRFVEAKVVDGVANFERNRGKR